jgi:hypothetical protein
LIAEITKLMVHHQEGGDHEEKPNANSKGKKSRAKTKLGIPDLEMSKAAVVRSLGSPGSRQQGYQCTGNKPVPVEHSLHVHRLYYTLLCHRP